MPKKTSEAWREELVVMRREGLTYSQIERKMTERGTPITRPTLIKVFREAGLTKPAQAVANPSETILSKPGPRAASPSVAPSNGVEEFMPKNQPKPVQKEYACDDCGAEFVADDPSELPDNCPNCGA